MPWKPRRDDSTPAGDAALPVREKKEQRKADQADAARREDRGGFSVGGRPGREGGSWDSNREH